MLKRHVNVVTRSKLSQDSEHAVLVNNVYCMGQCSVCGKETKKVLFQKAVVKIYICSETCLQKYFAPIGGVDVLKKLAQSESWLD